MYQKKNLYQPLEKAQPDSMSVEEWKVLYGQALGVVKVTLARNIAFNFTDEMMIARLIKTLSDMHEKPTMINKVHLFVVCLI